MIVPRAWFAFWRRRAVTTQLMLASGEEIIVIMATFIMMAHMTLQQ